MIRCNFDVSQPYPCRNYRRSRRRRSVISLNVLERYRCGGKRRDRAAGGALSVPGQPLRPGIQPQLLLGNVAPGAGELWRDYRVETVPLPDFREVRSEISLATGVYDIHWLHTNRQRETRLRPIRIPLLKGMIGWRLLLIPEQAQERFSAITHVDQLRKLRTVQGHDWPDALILQHNGFSVIRSANWEGMFRMLALGRVDYFPRGATEVHSEIAQFPDHGLAVEQSLVLHYPSAYYFFVARDNDELAEVIEKGLNVDIVNGSFD